MPDAQQTVDTMLADDYPLNTIASDGNIQMDVRAKDMQPTEIATLANPDMVRGEWSWITDLKRNCTADEDGWR